MTEWKQAVTGENPFGAVLVTAFEYLVIIDMVV
jgi:hypothetical protein